MADLTRTKITAAEFYEMFPETTEPIELIEGEVIVSPAPLYIHQKILRKITVAFSLVVDTKELGEVVMAPSDVHLDEENVVQPDLFFVAKDNPNCKVLVGYWYGAPDLCVEILSKASVRMDRVKKFGLYQKHGVREYWIVDPLENFIEVYVLDGGQYRRHGAYTETDTLTSVVLPELTLNLADVFPAEGGVEPPPAS